MNVDRLAASATVRAPAKLNLFFEVLAKRGDGYHEIETLMVPISLFDTLVAKSRPDGRVGLECRWARAAPDRHDSLGTLPADTDNLAVKAAERLRQRAGVAAGISLELIKRIPTQAGLGGASSDAAAALLAANAVWKLGWSRQTLAQVGAEIGSDVPFFLSPGAAICRGRGEQVESIAGLGALHFVLVRPPEGLATPGVYQNCRPADPPRHVEPLIAGLLAGDTRAIRTSIHNRLQAPAAQLSPWIGRLEREFAGQDCLAAQMTGSGSGFFGICRHARHARRVAGRLQARGLGHVYAVSTSNSGNVS